MFQGWLAVLMAGYKICEYLVEGMVNFGSIVGKIFPSFTGMPPLLARVLLPPWPLGCDRGHVMD